MGELRELLAQVLILTRSRVLTPLMDHNYTLADLIAAHRYVETGRKVGNVVVSAPLNERMRVRWQPLLQSAFLLAFSHNEESFYEHC